MIIHRPLCRYSFFLSIFLSGLTPSCRDSTGKLTEEEAQEILREGAAKEALERTKNTPVNPDSAKAAFDMWSENGDLNRFDGEWQYTSDFDKIRTNGTILFTKGSYTDNGIATIEKSNYYHELAYAISGKFTLGKNLILSPDNKSQFKTISSGKIDPSSPSTLAFAGSSMNSPDLLKMSLRGNKTYHLVDQKDTTMVLSEYDGRTITCNRVSKGDQNSSTDHKPTVIHDREMAKMTPELAQEYTGLERRTADLKVDELFLEKRSVLFLRATQEQQNLLKKIKDADITEEDRNKLVKKILGQVEKLAQDLEKAISKFNAKKATLNNDLIIFNEKLKGQAK